MGLIFINVMLKIDAVKLFQLLFDSVSE